jgi:hypothetical protein
VEAAVAAIDTVFVIVSVTKAVTVAAMMKNSGRAKINRSSFRVWIERSVPREGWMHKKATG